VTDLNPDVAAPPIVVDPAKWKDQIATAARDMGLVITATTALLGLLKRHSWAEAIAYVQSNDFLTAAGIVGSAAIFVWRQWNARHQKARLVTVAEAAPNSVAKLTTDAAPRPAPAPQEN
jgi:hypothetical protein